MADRVKTKGRRANCRREVWVFFKAQVSAQLASVVDFFVTILLATFFHIFYLYATFLGSVAGGVVNCFINYRWVFHAEDCKKLHVALKYILVWGGSIALNTWGTFILTEWWTDMSWLNKVLGPYVDNVFIVAKGIVAVLVGFFWNYHLQRIFVYRNHNIKRFWRQCFVNKNR